MDIKPFKIAIPQPKIDRLKQKLALADFPDELDGAGWDYGAPLDDVKRLAAHWRDGFDWRKAEAHLNELPQFTADVQVDGFEPLRVHFVHAESDVGNAVPLLFVHGWPGSFVEVEKMLPELLKGGGDHPAFHVVAPSLVNFGFSQGTKKKGWSIRQHAQTCHKLMQALGYEQYVTQAGDIGSSVTRALDLLYPSSCKASHFNFCVPSPPTILKNPDIFFQAHQAALSEAERAGMERTKWFHTEGMGYNLQQSTKPQTIGYGVTDSPVGLLAWIYEKLHDWSDAYPWTDDEVCTWVSIYQFSTAGPAASQRQYYESKHDPTGLRAKLVEYVEGPKLGFARFPKELFIMPKAWNGTMGEVVLVSEHERGGHFAAHERPDAIVKDLRDMFGKGGGAYAVVQGSTGYAAP